MTRNCSLSGTVMSAGFECMKPAPKQNSLGRYRKNSQIFLRGEKNSSLFTAPKQQLLGVGGRRT